MFLLNCDNWIISNCWLAVFDILGYRDLLSVEKDDMKFYQVLFDYQDTLNYLKESCNQYEIGWIDYSWFSDTFLMFTPDDFARSYRVIEFASKNFIEKCLYSRIPMRAAIAVGPFMRTKDNRTFIGKAFLEAFEYAEDQDWIGLLMTSSAIKKAESFGLNPTHHDFVRSDKIPMRKFAGQNILAYRFQNGAANFSSPLLPILREMKQLSDENYRYMYERTEQFIEEHYRYI